MWSKIKRSKGRNVREANNRKFHNIGTIYLAFEIGNRVEVVNFNVVERLSANVLPGWDYFEKYVEAFKPRQRVVQLDDRTTLPIIQNTGARGLKSVPLPEEQRFSIGRKRGSKRIRVNKPVTLQPETQTPVTTSTEQSRLIIVEMIKKRFNIRICLAVTGIAKVQQNKEFGILHDNMGKHQKKSIIGQNIATTDEHPIKFTEAPFTNGEFLGVKVEKL